MAEAMVLVLATAASVTKLRGRWEVTEIKLATGLSSVEGLMRWMGLTLNV